MKQRIIMALVALHSLVVAFAGNIVVGDLTMKPGETKALEISLSGSVSNVYGIQFDIKLPKEFSFVKGSGDKVFEMAGNQAEDITCDNSELGEGVYRFLIYSTTLQELRGGSLISVNLIANKTTTLGNYSVTISNVAVSDSEGHVTKEDGIAVSVKVTDFFTLMYQVDGEEYKSFEMEYGAIISPESEPTKEGYTFSGWNEIPETMPAQDVTIMGTFTANKYKLTYFVDGKEYKTFEVEYGTSVNKEAFPEQEGYTFSGWSEIPETMPAHDVTVTGSFTVNTYTLTYMVDGEVYKTVDYAYGTAITPEDEPAKEGYTFSGWGDIATTMPANDVTVSGTFTVNTYTITYQLDGEFYKSYDIDFGSAITPEAEPTKEGYSFSGWSEIPEVMPALDITVTGEFTINKYMLTYIVDGEEYKSLELEYGTTLNSEAEPEKEGYTFSGWSDIPETMPANDITVTGTFTINSYKLTYVVDGEEYKSFEIEYGTSLNEEAEPEKEGHTFSGWSDIPETMPANDVTINGKFRINTYKLTYVVDGQEYKSFEVEYGSSIDAEAEPTKEGHTFSGWSELPETMPAKDLVATGSFTINKYVMTYTVDGEEYKTFEVEYGSSITAEAIPEKEGYTFSGWSEIPETMPANDVTVTGSFTVNTYTLTYQVDGEVYKTCEVAYGTAITPEAEPEKEGYTFSGWSEMPETMPANDVAVTGTFTINTYQVTYIIGGEVFKTDSVQYGAAIVVPDATEREDYTFDGWADVPETMPAHDIVIYGSYTSGIVDVSINEKNVIIYDVKGRRIPKLQRGVNIIRTRDGRMRKVMVK